MFRKYQMRNVEQRLAAGFDPHRVVEIQQKVLLATMGRCRSRLGFWIFCVGCSRSTGQRLATGCPAR